MAIDLFQLFSRKPSSWSWLSIVLWSLWAIGAANAESDPIDAEHWRRQQLTKVARKIDEAASENERMEYEARLSWLRHWQPGQMTSAPTRPPIESDLVEEPLLGRLERPAKMDADVWQRITSAQVELHAVDTDDDRKEKVREIIESARRFEELLSEHLPSQLQQLPTPTAWTLAYARYRLGRALAYRELPSVRERWPISDPVRYQQQLSAVYQRLIDQAGHGCPEFILLEDRMLRRAGQKGRALKLLEANQQSIDPKWYLKKRRDLLDELGWEPPYQEAAQIYFEAGYRDDP
ncbi:hypothetical protein [Novipirellula caenicola]|uniref:Uncharacterized protein n=1 Tax=Novipirellula caenicola TaxID=1536901 RepID=A0ABP9VMT5_9BACT